MERWRFEQLMERLELGAWAVAALVLLWIIWRNVKAGEGDSPDRHNDNR